MLAYIKGKIKERSQGFLIVENSGLGYKVFVPSDVLLRVQVEEDIELNLYQHVREDALQLFGFEKPEQLKLFEQLISISGVGPKTGLAVFAEAEAADIVFAIVNGDASILKKVSGIGAKTAERIVLELKNKVDASISPAGLKSREEMDTDSDVVEALVSLGYSSQQARDVVKSIDKDITDLSEKVKQALKNLK